MSLAALKKEAYNELTRILDYWKTYCIDPQGGVVGRIDNDNLAYPEVPRGSVLHARVLWTFSAAGDIGLARRLFANERFWDAEHGGVVWTDTNSKKQIYAQAFTIYAYSEYYNISNDTAALDRAIELYHLIEQHSYDPQHGGYFEAFSVDWQPIDDLRLSEKDANEKKTMNTHLHVLEAYTNLYRIWPNADLARSIHALLNIFYNKIIDHQTGHLHLFFDEHWNVKGNTISYGHDIEASWLLLEAAELFELKHFQQLAIQMTDAVFEGIDKDGGLWHEDHIKEKHWWPQAEALVGFINAYQLTHNEKYVTAALNTWSFIKTYILDTQHGEWFWGIKEDHSIMNEDKAGLWKCPYHNGRACLELIKRI